MAWPVINPEVFNNQKKAPQTRAQYALKEMDASDARKIRNFDVCTPGRFTLNFMLLTIFGKHLTFLLFSVSTENSDLFLNF